MKEHTIDSVMEEYISAGEMAAGILIVQKKGRLVYHNRWGYVDSQQARPVAGDTIFRLGTLTEPLTAVGILRLYEKGALGLEDEVRNYLPQFARRQVVSEIKFDELEELPLGSFVVKNLSLDEQDTVPASRELTVRDLLTHSSGPEMGLYGQMKWMGLDSWPDTLEGRVEKLSEFALDFQPGMGTGNSSFADFDLLARMIEVISGKPFDIYMREEIFRPLEMEDTAFGLTQEQKKRLIPLYKPVDGKQVDVSGAEDDIDEIMEAMLHYTSGSRGAYGTAQDYSHFTEMLSMGGCYRGRQLLKPETVRWMRQERGYQKLELEPGYEWGLGVKVLVDPVRRESFAARGTYGYSGTFGDHFFVSPTDGLSAAFMMNRAAPGDLGSQISRKVEEFVFQNFM